MHESTVYAVAQLVVQVPTAAIYLILIAAEGTSTAVVALTIIPYLRTVLSISSSTCLLFTRQEVGLFYDIFAEV